jgi:hypothetical protein
LTAIKIVPNLNVIGLFFGTNIVACDEIHMWLQWRHRAKLVVLVLVIVTVLVKFVATIVVTFAGTIVVTFVAKICGTNCT